MDSMKKVITIILLFFVAYSVKSQVLIVSPNYTYTQNFGTTAISTWINNSTFLGWSYDAAYTGELNITAAAPTNTGGRYGYTFNGATDRKIGSRASGGTSDIEYGVLFQNTSGQTIQSFSVNYTGYQVSIGGNTNANTNILAFDYIISAATIPITAAFGTAVPALNYTQTQFVTVANTGSQGTGYPGTFFSNLNSGCLSIAASIPNNSYILLRWNDPDDGANDPHFAIDNIVVKFFTNQTVVNNTACSTLPITLTDFYAKPNESAVELVWNIETERNVNYYIVERSNDGINFVPISTIKSVAETEGYYNLNYSTADLSPKIGINYYRLVNVDKDGSKQNNKTIMVNFNKTHSTEVWINQTETEIIISYENSFLNKTFYLMDLNGKKIGEFKNLNTDLNYFTIDKLSLPKGLYVIGCVDSNMPPQKVLIN